MLIIVFLCYFEGYVLLKGLFIFTILFIYFLLTYRNRPFETGKLNKLDL